MRVHIGDIPTLRIDDDEFDVAGPISHVDSQVWPTAFVCEEFEDGDIVFGREVQLQLFRDCPFEIEKDHVKAASGPRWYASLVRIEKDNDLKGAFVVAASTPYSTDWFDYGRLRLPYKQSSQKREERLSGLLSDERGWQIALTEQTNDLFATDGKYLSAMLARPERVDRAVSLGRRTYEPWPKDDALAKKAGRPGVCIGICRDIEGSVRRLMEYWRCAALVADAHAGDLFEKYFQNHEKFQQSPKPKPVHQEAKPLAERAMAAAIKKALAGPISDEFVDDHAERRVSKLAGWIYLQLMYALCQRFEREVGSSKLHGTPNIDSAFGTADGHAELADELDDLQTRIKHSDVSKDVLVSECLESAKSTDYRVRRLSCLLAAAVCLECGREPELIRILQELQEDSEEQVSLAASILMHLVL